MNIFDAKLKIHAFFFLILFLSGCATVSKKSDIASYTISGTRYFSLASLSDAVGASFDYDTVTRTMEIAGNGHSIRLSVGSDSITVDSVLRQINKPVVLLAGLPVASEKFRREIFDVVFKRDLPAARQADPFSVFKKVVIDAGHGGKDPGAIGRSGLQEKDVTLDIARKLQSRLEKLGVKVLMTRSQDRFIPLEERVRMTNSAKADLFLSIHANANRVRSLNGFEVYYITPEVNDYKRAVLSAQKDDLNLDRICFLDPDLNLRAILWDMTHNYNRAEAITLSNSICSSIGRNLKARIIGTKAANFHVLRGACIPSVLVEVGFLSNSDEELLLDDQQYRAKIADGIISGLLDYATELARSKPVAVGQHDLLKAER